jgi:hypothetical protein
VTARTLWRVLPQRPTLPRGNPGLVRHSQALWPRGVLLCHFHTVIPDPFQRSNRNCRAGWDAGQKIFSKRVKNIFFLPHSKQAGFCRASRNSHTILLQVKPREEIRKMGDEEVGKRKPVLGLSLLLVVVLSLTGFLGGGKTSGDKVTLTVAITGEGSLVPKVYITI